MCPVEIFVGILWEECVVDEGRTDARVEDGRLPRHNVLHDSQARVNIIVALIHSKFGVLVIQADYPELMSVAEVMVGEFGVDWAIPFEHRNFLFDVIRRPHNLLKWAWVSYS